jgi:hypothetical protein
VGLNCCKSIIDAMRYVNMEVLAEVEIDGTRIDGGDKITAQRMRIVRVWRWTVEDTVLFVAYEVGLYFEALEKESRLGAVHSKAEIKSARALIENPKYENMVAAITMLFGGGWSLALLEGAFSWALAGAASDVSSDIGARVVFSKIRADFFRKSHGWIVKHTKEMEAL